MHRESWLAWFGWGSVSLGLFAVVWFYGVFYLSLKIPLRALLQPFLALSVILGFFATGAKVARERLINKSGVAPMVVVIIATFQFGIWSLGYYAARLGFLSHSAVAFIYFLTPALMVGTGIAVYCLMRKSLAQGRLKIRL